MAIRHIAATFGLALSLSGLASYASAAGIDDPRRTDYFKDFSGKTIAFLPVACSSATTKGAVSSEGPVLVCQNRVIPNAMSVESGFECSSRNARLSVRKSHRSPMSPITM